MTGRHRSTRWWAVGVCVLAVAGFARAPLPTMGATPPDPIQIGYSSLDSSINALFVTADRGLFTKYGLDAKLVLLDTAARATQALAAGAVDVTIVSGVSGMDAIANGLDVVFIGETLQSVSGSMVTRAEVTDPATQLKGAKWAISSFGSDSELGADKALEYYGLKPGVDVTLVPIGNQSLRFAALESGAAAATTLLPPVLEQAAADKRFKVWVPISKLLPNYLESAWLVGRKPLAAHPDVFRRMLQAYAEGTQFYKTHKAESLPTIEKWFKVDAPTASQAYDYYAPLMVVNPRISPETFQATLATMPPAQQKALTMASVVDMGLVTSLETQGFFQSLTGK